MTDDLERRLQEWGAWAAEVGPVPVLSPAARRRRLSPVVAAAAVVVVAVGTVLAVGRPSAPHAVAPPATERTAGVIPWADLPAPREVPAQAAVPDPSVPPCSAAHLQARAELEPSGGAGTTFELIHVQLRGGAPTCLLDGQPSGLIGTTTDGRRAAFRFTHYASSSFVLQPVVLRAGVDRGELIVVHPTRCDTASTPRAPAVTDVAVQLPSGPLPVPGWTLVLGCSPLTGTWQSTRVGALPSAAPAPHDATRNLTVTLQAPDTVRAGTTLRYTATLTNATATAVALSPCPRLLQVFAGVKQPGQLNCGPAHPVPAGSSEVFAMELAVPPTTGNGSQALSWYARSMTTRVQVTITGGGAPAQPQICSPDATSPPCGPFEPGTAVPYVLQTHCGIQRLYADGRAWRPTPGQNLPLGEVPARTNRPTDAGSVEVSKAHTLLTYTSSGGSQITMRPEVPQDKPVPLCS